MAKDFYRENFRKQGYVHKGIKKWEPAKRTTLGRKGAAANYPTLLSSTIKLFSGLRYSPGDGRVVVSNPVPYAPVHNWGFQGVQNVTQHTRKNSLSNLSLKVIRESRITVRAHTRNANIPQRQFLGESDELTAKLQKEATRRALEILRL